MPVTFRTFFKFLFLGLPSSLLLWPTPSFGWGSYGHEQISSAAIEALRDTSVGKCLATNRPFLVRLAITPDYDWKMIGTAPTDPTLLEKKKENDKYEHPLHFFEGDAFAEIASEETTSAAIAALPSGDIYSTLLPAYKTRLSANADWVVRVDPDKKLVDKANPTDQEVTEHGTAPWRILQLYQTGVTALKAGDNRRAVFLLGAMGHYVGDMSQPFHATLNYDGMYFVPSARGIHHSYEEAILEEEAKAADSKLDPVTKLWSSFAATEPGMVAALAAMAQSGELAPVPGASLVPEVLKLVGSGYPLVRPLLSAFTFAQFGTLGGFPPPGQSPTPTGAASSADARKNLHDNAPTIHLPTLRKFLALDYQDPTRVPAKTTVLQTALDRMTASSALLARLWLAAYLEAGNDGANCPAFAFDAANAIVDYPVPDYLPK